MGGDDAADDVIRNARHLPTTSASLSRCASGAQMTSLTYDPIWTRLLTGKQSRNGIWKYPRPSSFHDYFFSLPVRKSIYNKDIILYKNPSWNFLEWETAGKANSYIYRSQHLHRTWIDGGIFIECLRTKWTAQNWAVPILNVVLEIWLM